VGHAVEGVLGAKPQAGDRRRHLWRNLVDFSDAHLDAGAFSSDNGSRPATISGSVIGFFCNRLPEAGYYTPFKDRFGILT
jgi:hypothetical protein